MKFIKKKIQLNRLWEQLMIIAYILVCFQNRNWVENVQCQSEIWFFKSKQVPCLSKQWVCTTVKVETNFSFHTSSYDISLRINNQISGFWWNVNDKNLSDAVEVKLKHRRYFVVYTSRYDDWRYALFWF